MGLPRRAGNLILAELDLHVGHIAPHGMKRRAEIHGWVQVVWLVVAYRDVAWTPQSFEQRLR